MRKIERETLRLSPHISQPFSCSFVWHYLSLHLFSTKVEQEKKGGRREREKETKHRMRKMQIEKYIFHVYHIFFLRILISLSLFLMCLSLLLLFNLTPFLLSYTLFIPILSLSLSHIFLILSSPCVPPHSLHFSIFLSQCLLISLYFYHSLSPSILFLLYIKKKM